MYIHVYVVMINVCENIINYVNLLRGIAGGEENGRRGYLLTFSIAYIRVSPLLQ